MSKNEYISVYEDLHDDPALVVEKLKSISNYFMDTKRPVWARYRRKYRRGVRYGNNLTMSNPSIYFTNYVFALVESVKANIIRNLPELTVMPVGEKDDKAADVMGKILSEDMERCGMTDVLQRVLTNGLISTHGWFKVTYDPDKSNGMGGNIIESVRPEHIFIDPYATTEADAMWIIQKHPNVPLDVMMSRYGKIPDEEKGATNGRQNSDVKSNDYVEISTSVDPLDDMEVANHSYLDTYDVYEAWIKVIDQKDKKKNGWYVATIAGTTCIGFERSTYDHGQTPFVVWFDGFDDTVQHFYARGIGEIEEIESIQDRSDALNLKIYRNIELLSNRQRFVSAQSGVNANIIDNTAGRTYNVNGDPSKAVHYDSPPTLSQDVYQYAGKCESEIEIVSGVFDVLMGQKPAGVANGRAMQTLKDSSLTRIAVKFKSFAETMEKVGNLSLSNLIQYFSADIIRRIIDSDGNVGGIIKEYPQSLQSDSPDEAMLKDREIFKQDNNILLVLSDCRYGWDIRANTDNGLPATRPEKAQVALDMFRIGMIDRQAGLELINFPKTDQIIARMGGQVSGKNAGDPMAEQGMQSQQVMQVLMQVLQQAGIDPQTAQGIVEQFTQAEASQGQQGGNFPPQVVK